MLRKAERPLRAAATAFVFVGLAEVLFDLEPGTSDFLWPLLFGVVAAPALAVVLALRAVDLQTCIANGLAALGALPFYAHLTCTCAPPSPGNELPPGAALVGLLLFVSLPGFVGLVATVWLIAVRVKRSDLWEPKQW